MQPSPRTRFYLINLGLPLLLAALVFVLSINEPANHHESLASA